MPQTVFDQGDPVTSRLKLGVTPDGSTVVAVAVTAPDGSAQPVAGPTSAGADEWVCQWTAALAGDYVAVWTVTGTGAAVQAKVYPVRPLPAAGDDRPAWAPLLSDVADYIPRLTVDTTTPGSAVEYGTFTGLTTPTDEQAQRLVDRAVAAVLAAAGPVQAAYLDLARTVAALRAAAAIQRAYPRTGSAGDLGVADALDRRADAELAALVGANAAAASSGDYALLPLYKFPDPPTWADLNL